ncbi:c-type cytochrome [soil metagenome]
MTRPIRSLVRVVLAGIPVVTAVTGGAMALAGTGAGTAPAIARSAGLDPDGPGADLYVGQCAACPGVAGRGVDGRGPTLEGEGRAAVDFVLRTGRMPMADPDAQARSGPVRYTEAQIVTLVDYVGGFGDGPDIPAVDAASGDMAAGGQIYRLECAACHTASLAGAPIGGGREAPSLADTDATVIGEAILVGPGAMPRFGTLGQQDVDDVAAYIVALQSMDTTTAHSFGGAGPVAEGLSAWLLGLLPIVAVTRWIGGSRERGARSAPGGTS